MSTVKRGCCLALALLCLCGLIILPTAAADGGTVKYSCPAIAVEVGQSVKLTGFAVEFTSSAATAASEITWSSEDIKLGADGSVTPTAAGVYALTATAGTRSRTVYLVAKGAGDSEYVLYSNDFSSTDISDFRVVQQTSGATIDVVDGKLVLDASGKSSYYIRLLLPSWLSAFGDCKLTAELTIEKAAATTNWISLMARVQNYDYPYWQACLRQGATATNGTEIAERTSANKWNVTHTCAYSEAISASKQYEYSFELQGSNACSSINGEPLLFSSAVTQTSGNLGVQSRGCRLVIDSIKVTLPTGTLEAPEANVHTTREQSSGLIMTPAVASRINSQAELDAIQTTSPSTAILNVNSALEVTTASGSRLCTLDAALEALGKTVIPAFYLSDTATVTALCAELERRGLEDVLFIAADDSLLSLARTTHTHSQAILDCTSVTAESLADTAALYQLRHRANACLARTILLSDTAATRDNVEYLQRLLMTVWSEPADTATGYASAITSGANGIVVADRAAYEKLLTESFEENTLTRLVNIIGHRGVPSLAQENTIAGSVLAYEMGATMIENDIYITRDNVIVVMHDSTLDRTTNGTGKVESYTYAQLQKYQVVSNTSVSPEPIPTLEDYFKEFKGKDVRLVVEIKKDASTRIVDALAELIEQYDIADQVNVITFSESFMQLMHQKLPGISVGYLTSSITQNENDADTTLETVLGTVSPLGTTYNPKYSAGKLGYNLLRRLSERGLTVWPWTVNDRSAFDEYLLLGVGGITTNYSQWSKSYLRRLDAPESEIAVGEDGADFKLTQLTYGRKTTEVTDAQLVVVESNGADVSYADGRLSATGSGSATVYFRKSYRTNSGKSYYLCTEPVIVTVSAGTGCEMPAETTPGGDTSPDATTTPVTPVTPTTTTADPGDTASDSGCGSTAGIAALVALLPAALVLSRKRRK